MKGMRQHPIMAILIVLVMFGLGYWWLGFRAPKEYRSATIHLGGQEFSVDIADTVSKQAQGLSGRPSLAENEGMLFVFKTYSSRTFWMKDMNFPIDMIWIKDNRIVGSAENAAPEPGKSVFSLTLYNSPEPVDKVLEVSAGTVARLGIKPDDTVAITGI